MTPPEPDPGAYFVVGYVQHAMQAAGQKVTLRSRPDNPVPHFFIEMESDFAPGTYRVTVERMDEV